MKNCFIETYFRGKLHFDPGISVFINEIFTL